MTKELEAHRMTAEVCYCPHHNCTCSPMYSFAEPYAALLQVIQPAVVFEWGPGESTRLALESGARVFAIEPSPEWAARVPAHPRLTLLVAPVDSPGYLDLHGHRDADLYFIDCRRRAECLDLVRLSASPTAIVCLHDAQRYRYQAALRRFPHVQYLERGFAVASCRGDTYNRLQRVM